MGMIRNRMIEQLKLRRYSRLTIKVYLQQIKGMVRFLKKSPDEITKPELMEYLSYLVNTRKISSSYLDQAVSAIKFLYRNVFKKPLVIEDLPRPKKAHKLPTVLSVGEVVRIF